MKTRRRLTIRPLIQAAVFATCLAGTLHAATEVERIHFNGKDFKGGQLIVPKLPPDKVKGIPFALSCGELDTTKAFDGKAPHGRLDWMKVFAENLKKRGFALRTEAHAGIGHGGDIKDHGQLIRECFLLATGDIVPESGKWEGDLKQFAKPQATPAATDK